jgi:hypothetical protein
MTLDIYADLFDDDLEAVAVALHQARSQARWEKCGHGMGRTVVRCCDLARKTGPELLFQSTRRATSTIAEVICAISSAPQM